MVHFINCSPSGIYRAIDEFNICKEEESMYQGHIFIFIYYIGASNCASEGIV